MSCVKYGKKLTTITTDEWVKFSQYTGFVLGILQQIEGNSPCNFTPKKYIKEI